MRTSRSYPIEPRGPERVTLSWEGSFRDLRVAFDGVECATLDAKKVTGRGDRAPLPDGSMLFVRVRGMLGVEVRRDDAPLPHSDLDPKRLLRNAGALLGVVAAIDLFTDVERWRHGAEGIKPLIGLEAGMMLLAFTTFFGQPVALALGVAAIAARVAMLPSRSTATLIFAVVAIWLLSTHFFAAWRRPAK